MLMLLLAHAELEGLICSGRPAAGEHTYALMSERVPTMRRLSRGEALAEVALRYFTGHGPATERDLAYWASLTLTDVRTGLAEVRDQLGSFQHEGRTYWHAPGDPPPAPQEPGRATSCRSLTRPIAATRTPGGYSTRRAVPRTRETAIGMALADAQIVASMQRTITPDQVQFDLRPYKA